VKLDTRVHRGTTICRLFAGREMGWITPTAERSSKRSETWFLRSRIAYALDVSLNRMETVLMRLLRKGNVQMRIDERGHALWRGV
jgi:hypothetical protein